MKRTPICLVTGFLGSGKTSLLKHLAARDGERCRVYLVNEFCEADIDGELLSSFSAPVVRIPGGSIFCQCLVTEFIGRLKWIREHWPEADGVIAEASGMANPLVTRRLLEETGLDQSFRLSDIITVVDPGTFPKLRQTLPMIVDQVKAADTILINKADLHHEDDIRKLRQELATLNPAAAIQVTRQGQADLNLFEGESACIAGGEYARCRDPHFESFSVDVPPPVDIERLTRALNDLSPVLYRAKGFVQGDRLTYYIDYAAGALTILPVDTGHQPRTGKLALILSGGADEATRNRARTLAAPLDTTSPA